MKKIVVIGGGTGNFVVLSGLKNYPVDLSVIVSMADDGGSTGILRDELGVLPPGDVRQCLVALSNSSLTLRNLMNYRFENGGLEGHSFGNLFLLALEKVTGSFEDAVEEVERILSIKEKVIPVTTQKVWLKMLLKSGKLLQGEGEIYTSCEIDNGFSEIYLEPKPEVNIHAIEAIMNADLVVISPGGIYNSIIPNLLVDGINKALIESSAKKLLVTNLVNRKGQTTNYKVSDYINQIVSFIGKDVFDYILVNNSIPADDLLMAYEQKGNLVENDLLFDERIRNADLLSKITFVVKGKKVQGFNRALIRYDSQKVAKEIIKIVGEIC